jgi:hypothetical protein
MMTEPFLAYRTAPEVDQAVRQLITNLQQQNRALVADRDRYASMMVSARDDAELLRAELAQIAKALSELWQAYVPSIAPNAAIQNPYLLHPAWMPIAGFLDARKVLPVEKQEEKIDWVAVWGY